MKTDRELLELAAEAAGIKPRDEWAFDEEWGLKVSHGAPPYEWWNPLIDDGDALHLAFTLKIDIEWQATQFGGGPEVDAYRTELDRGSFCASEHENDYRRAIVRAA